jgi:hypothetical protein
MKESSRFGLAMEVVEQPVEGQSVGVMVLPVDEIGDEALSSRHRFHASTPFFKIVRCSGLAMTPVCQRQTSPPEPSLANYMEKTV